MLLYLLGFHQHVLERKAAQTEVWFSQASLKSNRSVSKRIHCKSPLSPAVCFMLQPETSHSHKSASMGLETLREVKKKKETDLKALQRLANVKLAR